MIDLLAFCVVSRSFFSSIVVTILITKLVVGGGMEGKYIKYQQQVLTMILAISSEEQVSCSHHFLSRSRHARIPRREEEASKKKQQVRSYTPPHKKNKNYDFLLPQILASCSIQISSAMITNKHLLGGLVLVFHILMIGLLERQCSISSSCFASSIRLLRRAKAHFPSSTFRPRGDRDCSCAIFFCFCGKNFLAFAITIFQLAADILHLSRYYNDSYATKRQLKKTATKATERRIALYCIEFRFPSNRSTLPDQKRNARYGRHGARRGERTIILVVVVVVVVVVVEEEKDTLK
jgi:hypothetical protein